MDYNLLRITNSHHLLAAEYEKRVRLSIMIEDERTRLEKYAASGNAKAGYINKMNFILGTAYDYKESVENLHQAIAETVALFPPQTTDIQSLKRNLERAESENKKLRAWLSSLGKDLNLIPYINSKDLYL